MKFYKYIIINILLTVLLVPLSYGADQTIDQAGFSFNPTEVTIQPGDTVTWNWANGIHTVTNGTGALDPQAGILFDEPLSASNTTVSYTFNDPGTYDYFCRPHETFGMKGKVIVLEVIPAVAGFTLVVLILISPVILILSMRRLYS